MATAEAVLTGLREVRRQLQALEALVERDAATDRTFTTPELARLLRVTPEALNSWARRAGIGAVRDGFRVVGRFGNGPRPSWLWKAVQANG
jgi:hypothetical protein